MALTPLFRSSARMRGEVFGLAAAQALPEGAVALADIRRMTVALPRRYMLFAGGAWIRKIDARYAARD